MVSKNKPTIGHLEIACRHIKELTAAGVTENHAIRILELFADVYAKLLKGGSATPHHVRHVDKWSMAARKWFDANPSVKPGNYLRVEHGTPRRAFAKKVMRLYEDGNLTEATMADLVRNSWKLAVITVEEDAALNKTARSKSFSSPCERWRLAGIRFVGDEGVQP